VAPLLGGTLAVWACGPVPASAHAGGAAFVLLLPTHLYIAGGALAVAATFALLALLPGRRLARLRHVGLRLRVTLPARAGWLSTAASLLSLGVLGVLVAAGVAGSRDPLANPLPLVVWSLWWIGLTLLHAVLGHLWAHLNPWTGLYRVLGTLAGLRRWRAAPPLAYPDGAGSWPAVAGFLAFGWFELVYPAPLDPAVLAGVVAGYWAAQYAGLVAFGPPWLERAEPFSVFFRLVSRVAPVGLEPARPEPRLRAGERAGAGGNGPQDRERLLEVTLPALRLLRLPAPPASLGVFIVVVLAGVSFDGLSRTFTWLALVGENPLDYPGRSALILRNTGGLLGLAAALALAYLAAAGASARLSAPAAPIAPLVRLWALSLVPIACGYHFAHYLPALLVDAQWALRAASDPFGRGWDLWGTRDLPVQAAFLADPGRAWAVWRLQVALIVGAHVAGLTVAHALAHAAGITGRRGALGQLPLATLMVAYTMLGLWLLSTPAVG
jgi:hypothetical protein